MNTDHCQNRDQGAHDQPATNDPDVPDWIPRRAGEKDGKADVWTRHRRRRSFSEYGKPSFQAVASCWDRIDSVLRCRLEGWLSFLHA